MVRISQQNLLSKEEAFVYLGQPNLFYFIKFFHVYDAQNINSKLKSE